MLRPVSVTALPGYRIRIAFDDGVAGEADLSHLAGKGVFRLWETPGSFERVEIGNNRAIRWSDEVELCADALYLQITGQSPEDVFHSLMTAHRDVVRN